MQHDQSSQVDAPVDAALIRRRTVLKALLGLSCALPLSGLKAYAVDSSDDEFLEDLSRRSFQFFIDHAGPSGIIRDRARTNGETHGAHEAVGSIAATGFGLTGLCIAAERGWLPRADARERVRRTLAMFARQATAHGWFHHFLDIRTGARTWNSEVSSIDTALLLYVNTYMEISGRPLIWVSLSLFVGYFRSQPEEGGSAHGHEVANAGQSLTGLAPRSS